MKTPKKAGILFDGTMDPIEAAKYLGIAPVRMRALLKNGQIPSIKIPSPTGLRPRRRVYKRELDKLLEGMNSHIARQAQEAAEAEKYQKISSPFDDILRASE